MPKLTVGDRRVDGLCVVLGGAIGTLLRASVGALLPTPLGGFPTSTLIVNVVGSFLLGVLVVAVPAWAIGSADAQRRTRLVLGTGLLGGFTTFSAFSVETVLLVERQAWVTALGYVAASLLAGAAAALVGGVLGRRLARPGSVTP